MWPFHTIPAVIFDALCEHPYGLTKDQLVEVVYPNPDKEPDWAITSLTVCICRMNKKLKRDNSPFRIKPAGLKRYAIFVRRVRK